MLVRTRIAYEIEHRNLPAVAFSVAMSVAAVATSYMVSDRIAAEPQVLEVMPAEVGRQVVELGLTLRQLEAHTHDIARNVKPRADIVDRVVGGEDKAWRLMRAKSTGPVVMAADVKAGLETANRRVASVTADLQLMKDTIESRRAMVHSLPLARPVNGIVTSPFGARVSPIKGKPQIHEGIDIAAPKGSIVVAPADGTVISVGLQTGYGYSVEIDHGMGVVTVFAHLGRATIKLGDQVKRGQLIAVIGTTGQTTGPHLHHEVRLGGHAIDPQPFLAFDLAKAEAITQLGKPKT
jgi:murein DD-endopeptidase MepM/ murein hydrolase activator NlpD